MLIRNCDIHRIGFLSVYFRRKTFQLISLIACDIFLLNSLTDWYRSLSYRYIWSFYCCGFPSHTKYGIQIQISAKIFVSIPLDLFIIRDQDSDLTKQKCFSSFPCESRVSYFNSLGGCYFIPCVFEGSASFERFQTKACSIITCPQLVITNATISLL